MRALGLFLVTTALLGALTPGCINIKAPENIVIGGRSNDRRDSGSSDEQPDKKDHDDSDDDHDD
jgi:hypothetical protein